MTAIEIVASLRGCIAGNCSNCEYADSACGRDRLMKDAADLIEQLEMKLEVTRMNLADTRAELNQVEDDLRGAHDEVHRLMKKLNEEKKNG